MSHQSGISANSELLEVFSESREGKYRSIQIRCANEQLIRTRSIETKDNKSWRDSFTECVSDCLDVDHACYILFRLDSTGSLGYEWAFITWIPNTAHVREKMLYASTRATLRKVFGDAMIKEELLGHHKDDLTLAAYDAHILSKNAPKPFTVEEEEKREINKNETRQFGLHEGSQTIRGTDFLPSDEASDALYRYASEEIDYIHLVINVNDETIDLKTEKAELSVADIKKQIDMEQAGYHLFRFKHKHNSETLAPTIFIYTFVGYKIPVKQRMLFSSCKAPFLQRIEENFGIAVDKKVEWDASDTIDEKVVYEIIHPPQAVAEVQSAKPRAPGARRLIK